MRALQSVRCWSWGASCFLKLARTEGQSAPDHAANVAEAEREYRLTGALAEQLDGMPMTDLAPTTVVYLRWHGQR